MHDLCTVSLDGWCHDSHADRERAIALQPVQRRDQSDVAVPAAAADGQGASRSSSSTCSPLFNG